MVLCAGIFDDSTKSTRGKSEREREKIQKSAFSKRLYTKQMLQFYTNKCYRFSKNAFVTEKRGINVNTKERI